MDTTESKPKEGVPTDTPETGAPTKAQVPPHRRWSRPQWRTSAIIVLLLTCIVLSAGLVTANLAMESDSAKARQDASGYSDLQATNVNLSTSLAAMTQADQADQAQIATLKSQVASLTSQVASLTSQVANLQAQLPPTTGCPGDPGFRATVNQISIQTVGFSATQKVIDYLCAQGITSPGQVKLFFGQSSLHYLEQNFGYP